jgi:DNA-nicking Smr family endonuclease
MVTVKSLADLKQVKKAIETQAKLEAERKAEAAKRARQATADKDLFRCRWRRPALDRQRQRLKEQPKPISTAQHDEQAVLVAISDEFDISTLLETDEHLSYRRPGIGTDVTRKLRRGDWAIQRQLDLHGLRTEDAREALGQFIREAHQQGIRCVRVVHGKGLGSPGKTPVLKGRVQSWLAQKKEVLAFVQARPAEGGAGAVVVL